MNKAAFESKWRLQRLLDLRARQLQESKSNYGVALRKSNCAVAAVKALLDFGDQLFAGWRALFDGHGENGENGEHGGLTAWQASDFALTLQCQIRDLRAARLESERLLAEASVCRERLEQARVSLKTLEHARERAMNRAAVEEQRSDQARLDEIAMLAMLMEARP